MPRCVAGGQKPRRSVAVISVPSTTLLVLLILCVVQVPSTVLASDETTASSSSSYSLQQGIRRGQQPHVLPSLSTTSPFEPLPRGATIGGRGSGAAYDPKSRRQRRGRRTRHLTSVPQPYANSTLLRSTAVNWYRTYCPDFAWPAKKGKKGGTSGGCPGASSSSPSSSGVTFTKCGFTHELRRYGDVTLGPKQVIFRYVATRNGVPYSRRLSVVCPYDRRICSVINVWCGGGTAPPPASPTRKPAAAPTQKPAAPTPKPAKRPSPRPTRYPTAAPVPPSTRTCTSCLTRQNWTCAYAETCGCNVNNCLPPGTPPPNCSCQTMVPVPWNSDHQATIELCQDASDSRIFGYRLPGEDSCHLAALLVRVVPGNQYRLTIRNRAIDNTTTNLHTHGLHVSGDGNADNPMRVVSTGHCITYHWDIPADHMGGTLWMHSHDMQEGFNQVWGGALALFIVEENPSLLDDVDAASQPGIAAWLKNELLLVATRTLLGHRGNGLTNAQFNMTVGEWYRLRILGAEVKGNEFYLRLPSPCTIYMVAHDGVWRFVVPNVASPPDEAQYRMTSAGRLDVAIKCPSPGSFRITAVSSEIPNSVIATLNVARGTPTIATPFTSTGATWRPSRPSYLQNLLDPSVTVDNPYSITIAYSDVNGQNFKMNSRPLDNVTYGAVQEWTVTGSAKPHSYHQHVHHFQVVSCAGFDAGEFYDTILPTSNDNPCVLRFRVSDYSGNLFLHCHTIAHSESGAMARFHVTDGGITNGNEDYDEFVC